MATTVDVNRPCKAIITLAAVISEPVKVNGNDAWRPVAIDNTSLGVELVGHNHQQLLEQIRDKLEEYKKLWQNMIVSVENSTINANQES
jgi:hypothetical protein